jgi:hypothetical protein
MKVELKMIPSLCMEPVLIAPTMPVAFSTVPVIELVPAVSIKHILIYGK